MMHQISDRTFISASLVIAATAFGILAMQASRMLGSFAFTRLFLIYPFLTALFVIAATRLLGSVKRRARTREPWIGLNDAAGLQVIPIGCFLYTAIVAHETHSYDHAYLGVAVLSAQIGWVLERWLHYKGQRGE